MPGRVGGATAFFPLLLSLFLLREIQRTGAMIVLARRNWLIFLPARQAESAPLGGIRLATFPFASGGIGCG